MPEQDWPAGPFSQVLTPLSKFRSSDLGPAQKMRRYLQTGWGSGSHTVEICSQEKAALAAREKTGLPKAEVLQKHILSPGLWTQDRIGPQCLVPASGRWKM